MSGRWDPAQYRDSFREDILKLVGRKVAKGQLKDIATPTQDEKQPTAKIIDLTELLKQSLGNRANGGARKPEASARRKRIRPAGASRRKRA